MAQIRQSRPDSGIGAQEKVPTTVQSVPSWLGSGRPLAFRCRANMAHIRQSRPDSGLGFQVGVLKLFQVVPSWLGRGRACEKDNQSLSESRLAPNAPLCEPGGAKSLGKEAVVPGCRTPGPAGCARPDACFSGPGFRACNARASGFAFQKYGLEMRAEGDSLYTFTHTSSPSVHHHLLRDGLYTFVYRP